MLVLMLSLVITFLVNLFHFLLGGASKNNF